MKKRIVSALLFCLIALSACALPVSSGSIQDTASPDADTAAVLLCEAWDEDTAEGFSPAVITDPPAEKTAAEPEPLAIAAPETTALPEPETTAAPETTIAPETTSAPETTTAPVETESLDLAKTIFLTFDDGPSRGKTEEILRILDAYDIRATFFTVGMFVDYYPALTRQIVEGGHLLACHSYSHDYAKLYVSAETITADLAEWERAVIDAVGALPATRIYRFPGGTTSYSLTNNTAYPELLAAVTDAGYTPYDWTVATNDRYLAAKREEQTMEEFFLESLAFTLSLTNRASAPPKILLMHDTSADTVQTLPAVLDYLIEQGYTFATLDRLDAAYIVHQ